MNKYFIIFLVSLFSLSILSFAEVGDKKTIVDEIEVDGVFVEIGRIPNTEEAEKCGVELNDDGYIIVDGQKIITPSDFLEEAYFDVGDKVEITVEETDEGLEAVDYNYIFDDIPEMQDQDDTETSTSESERM